MRYLYTLLLLAPIFIFAQNPCPCCDGPSRQFDFWVGDWTVKDSTGKFLGTNHIVLVQDSCVLQENWTSGQSPYTGTSYNFFHKGDSVWKQLWLDNQGGYLELAGEWNGKAMQLESPLMTSAQGQAYKNRVTWTPMPDGRVRQHWEVTQDEGKSWNTVFDGFYERE